MQGGWDARIRMTGGHVRRGAAILQPVLCRSPLRISLYKPFPRCLTCRRIRPFPRAFLHYLLPVAHTKIVPLYYLPSHTLYRYHQFYYHLFLLSFSLGYSIFDASGWQDRNNRSLADKNSVAACAGFWGNPNQNDWWSCSPRSCYPCNRAFGSRAPLVPTPFPLRTSLHHPCSCTYKTADFFRCRCL